MDLPFDRQELQFDAVHSLADVPAAYDALFAETGAADFFLSKAWFQLFETQITDEGGRPVFLGLRSKAANPEGLILLIGRAVQSGRWPLGGRSLRSLANFYSMTFAPLIHSRVEQPAALLGTLLRQMARHGHRYPTLSLGPLDPDAATSRHLTASLRERGFRVETGMEFGCWFEPVAGRSFADYLQNRPSILRNTLRRRGKQAAKSAKLRFEVIAGGDDLERAIKDYFAIYAVSWKEPERYPDFIPEMIRTSARAGGLRLGLLYLDDVPAAGQIWMLSGKRAIIYKLAYDPRFKSLSVGSLLTEHLMQWVIERDRVDEVNYGSGDDDYKKEWMSSRREYLRVTAYNLRTFTGLCLGMIAQGRGWAKSAIRTPLVPALKMER